MDDKALSYVPAIHWQWPLITVLFPLAVAFLYLSTQLGVFKNSKCPPGPRGIPFVGNMLQVPLHKPWLYFATLGKNYGPIVRLHFGFEEVMVLNKADDAAELLGRRSRNYSSRRPVVYAGKYVTNYRPIVLSSGVGWSNLRAIYNSMFQTRELSRYNLLLELESSRLILNILRISHNEDLTKIIRRYTASVIYGVIYGKRSADDHKDVDEIMDIAESFVKDCYPGAHLVDTFPILDTLPDFLSPWRKEALRKRHWHVSFYRGLAEEVRKAMEVNMAPDCYASRLFEHPDMDEETIMQGARQDITLDSERRSNRKSLRRLSATGEMFQAATDTTASTILWFFVAILLHPHVLRKAQAEIDRVMGSDGTVMPGLRHFKQLPYCAAVLKETFRWTPVVPGCFPHLSDADDTYKGYTIKAKTMIIPNIWAMHRDEEQYPKASEFVPERFLDDDMATAPSPSDLLDGHYGFGFGRRICPGRAFGAQVAWFALVRVMWACNVDCAKTPDGKAIPVDLNHATTQIIQPLPFPVVITARSEKHERTIRTEWNDLKEIPLFTSRNAQN